MPWFFFASALLCWLYSVVAWGGISWQRDAYEHHFPVLNILSITTTVLMALFPVVALGVLVYNHRKWKKLLSPLVAYSLYLGFICLAGYMGWWVD